MGKIVLKGKGRRWLLKGHPWVYLDDVAGGKGEPGELLPVEAPDGEVMGWGLFSTSSRIAVRMVTRAAEQPTRELWAERMRRAVDLRARTGLLESGQACRLLSGDAEGIPGLVIDRYDEVVVFASGTQSADRMRDFLIELLLDALPFEPRALIDRSDASVRRLEQLEPRVELVQGQIAGPVTVREGQIDYEVDLYRGHKTGAYLDQRPNRLRAAQRASGARVIDAFAYDGLFGLHAARAGAEQVLFIEQNKAACERLQQTARRNGLEDRIEIVRANGMHELRDRAAALLERAAAGEEAGCLGPRDR